jgi:hypothetical protein
MNNEGEEKKRPVPVNITGKNRYGESQVRGVKIPKKIMLTKEIAEKLERIAKKEGMIQGDIIHKMILDYKE